MPNTDTTPRQIRAFNVFLLGRSFYTPDEIAETIEIYDIKGVCRVPGKCALALYLMEVFPDIPVLVGPRHVDFGRHGPYSYTNTVDLPESLRTFVARFDRGDYPNITEG